MRKLVCVLLVLTFILSGCHGQSVSNDFVVPDSFDESKTYEITFWAKNDSNKTQVQIYKDTIASFEKIYPNI